MQWQFATNSTTYVYLMINLILFLSLFSDIFNTYLGVLASKIILLNKYQ